MFRYGAGDQDGRSDTEAVLPELPPAGDVGNRFARGPTGEPGAEFLFFDEREPAPVLDKQPAAGETEQISKKQLGIKRRRA